MNCLKTKIMAITFFTFLSAFSPAFANDTDSNHCMFNMQNESPEKYHDCETAYTSPGFQANLCKLAKEINGGPCATLTLYCPGDEIDFSFQCL